ncbi:uncharacterized protein LOC134187291 [Corticium candelabrum]|uniref:uncharacterized protein LOC134187291 n=1 Tax=Corticium candelabrum TaxID=121492 RepID=UPI002E273E02|nr:uncharacterized protein LOC134187291 [Corticium candelabrum]
MQRSIQQLYEVILLDLEQVQKDMSWKAPGRGITELKMGFVKLTLAVFHLIAALTSVEALDEPLIAFGRRRTVEAKWSCWCEALRNVIDHPPATVSWLQVLTMLLEKHPDCISDEDVVVLLDLVYVIQKETNWVKVVHWSMSCLRELAVACKGRLRQQHDQWMKVWATAVRLVSQHRCEEAAFDLLAALLQCNIVSPDIEPWRLLGQCIPSSQAVNFVLSHFQSHSIPENFKTNQGVVHGKDGTLFPLRRQLFDWLLPVPDKSLGRFTAEVTEDGNFKLDASSRASPPQAAQLLFALTQKDPKNAINTMQLSCAFSSVENEGSCQWDSFLCQMGQSYLCSTFSTLIEENKVAVTHLVTSRSVTSLQLLLCEQMAKLCEHLVTPFESKHCMSLQETKQAVLDTIKFAAYLCSIVIHTVSLLAFSNSVTLDGMEESDLIVSLSKLLQFLASQINELSFVQDEMDQSTYNVFTALQHLESMLFVLTCSANRTREEQEQLKKLRQICKTVIPSSLVHCLIRISDGQVGWL